MKDFKEIYKDNYQIVYRVGLKTLNDNDVVADIVQETFILLYENLKSGKEINFPKTWLYRVTLNKCYDYIKNQNKNIELELNNNIAEESNLKDDNKSKLIKIALSKLKPEEKSLVVLYSEGLSYKELSEVTGIKYTSIGKTLSRILQKLRTELKNKEYELF